MYWTVCIAAGILWFLGEFTAYSYVGLIQVIAPITLLIVAVQFWHSRRGMPNRQEFDVESSQREVDSRSCAPNA